MASALRPPYVRWKGRPSRCRCSAIAIIGVIPMPPATSAWNGASSSTKWFLGRVTNRRSPTRSVSWTYVEPPVDSASRSTAIFQQDRSSGSPHREYCRVVPSGT